MGRQAAVGFGELRSADLNYKSILDHLVAILKRCSHEPLNAGASSAPADRSQELLNGAARHQAARHTAGQTTDALTYQSRATSRPETHTLSTSDCFVVDLLARAHSRRAEDQVGRRLEESSELDVRWPAGKQELIRTEVTGVVCYRFTSLLGPRGVSEDLRSACRCLPSSAARGLASSSACPSTCCWTRCWCSTPA